MSRLISSHRRSGASASPTPPCPASSAPPIVGPIPVIPVVFEVLASSNASVTHPQLSIRRTHQRRRAVDHPSWIPSTSITKEEGS
ncbi:hypothetical protein ACFX13_018751 [Malus domestica]